MEVNGRRVCRLLWSWETVLVILSGRRSSPQAVIGMFTQLPSPLSRRRMVSGSVTSRPRSEYMFNLVRKLWERCENDLSACREDAGHVKYLCKIKIDSRAADTTCSVITIHAANEQNLSSSHNYSTARLLNAWESWRVSVFNLTSALKCNLNELKERKTPRGKKHENEEQTCLILSWITHIDFRKRSQTVVLYITST